MCKQPRISQISEENRQILLSSIFIMKSYKCNYTVLVLRLIKMCFLNRLMECLLEQFQVNRKIGQKAQIPILLLHFLHIVSTIIYILHSVQFSSVAQSCPTLPDLMNRSTPGLPVHHQLPEITQTHVHQVSDAIQPSHPLSSSSPSAPNPSQHQSFFQ